MPWLASLPGLMHTRLADAALAARLVDVPVHREQRLVLLDQPPHRGRADRAAQDVAGRDRRPQVLVQDRRRVETGVVRRDVDHEDRAPRVATWSASASRRRVQLVLRHLPGVFHGVRFDQPYASSCSPPGMSRTFAVRVDRREVVPVEDRVDREVVVVSRDQVERHVGVGEPLGRELHPRLDALVHQPVQERVALGLVGREPLGVVARRDERVEADVGDVPLELRELLVGARGPARRRTARPRSACRSRRSARSPCRSGRRRRARRPPCRRSA